MACGRGPRTVVQSGFAGGARTGPGRRHQFGRIDEKVRVPEAAPAASPTSSRWPLRDGEVTLKPSSKLVPVFSLPTWSAVINCTVASASSRTHPVAAIEQHLADLCVSEIVEHRPLPLQKYVGPQQVTVARMSPC